MFVLRIALLISVVICVVGIPLESTRDGEHDKPEDPGKTFLNLKE